MSSKVGSDQAHSLDDHEPVRTHTRTRSSTFGGMGSSNTVTSEFLSFGGDAPKHSKLRKTSNWPQTNRARANSSTNMINTGLFGIQSASPLRPATAESHINGRHKSRGSVFIAATDALGLKLGRRKLSVSQHPQPIVLPDVIDISAARADAETEERKRLREMAAQAIGLQSYAVSSLREESVADEEERFPQTPVLDKSEVHMSAYDAQSSFTSHDRPMPDSSLSVSIPHSQPSASRLPLIAHSPATTTSISPIPPYPSTLSSLTSFRQCAGTYPKYYPPSSLRIFALSKNWKHRYLMMSSPATLVTRGQSPAVSYLHLFKSGNPDEVELERLEINEDSVVFVAEDEVGGKRSVIKVGGADVGAMKKDYLVNEGGYSMWLLQMQDTTQAQKWIANIKNAILSQRTVRAGLIPAYALGANEPRGDMDVMLSIRAQGIMMSVPKSGPTSAKAPAFENSSLSSRSVNSLKTSGKLPGSSMSAVSALKGLFTASRPRSASRATSIESERQQERDLGEESFAGRGNNLLSMLSSSTPDSQSMFTVQGTPARTSNPQFVSADRLDRKILTDSLPVPWEDSMSLDRENAVNRTATVEVSPLEPPPRKRWASGLAVASKPDNPLFSSQTNCANTSSASVTRSSIETAESGRQASPRASFQFGTPEQRPRAPSLQSVSTYASEERRISMERSSSSTKQSSARRWSKKARPPQNDLSQAVTDQAMNRASSPNSSRDSQRSFVSALPSFYKRTSGSDSSQSANSSGVHQNTMRARSSVPPPCPAPTFALPPAPQGFMDDIDVDDVLKPLEAVSNASRISFRTSLNRPLRLSLVAPKPPPNAGLPPRPDESDYPSIRRLSSESSTHRYSSSLEAIPASPFPPPSGPLPPPPPVDPLPPRRIDSFKQRLRILSTGPTFNNGQAFGKLRLSTARSSRASSPVTTSSPPATPIAEKIMPFPDNSFLQMYTPIMSTPPTPPTIVGQLPPQDLFPQESEIPAVTSLSPPPRRGSKQVAETDFPPLKLVQTAEESSLFVTGKQKQTSMSTPDSRNHDFHIPPELTERLTLEGRSPLPDNSSGCEDKIVSCADSRHHVAFSRPSSLVSQISR